MVPLLHSFKTEKVQTILGDFYSFTATTTGKMSFYRVNTLLKNILIRNACICVHDVNTFSNILLLLTRILSISSIDPSQQLLTANKSNACSPCLAKN
jgi:hypothetical protein